MFDFPLTFSSFWSAHSTILWSVFGIALIMGAVVNKTNFCTMGAVSDWVNMGDTGRFRAWMFALSIAMLGVVLLEYNGIGAFDATMPPYRSSNLQWPNYILGGLLFGIGMTLGSGCGNKTLIRVGGGNLKSIVVFFVLGSFAYLMLNPPPFVDTDKTLYSVLFYYWMDPIKLPMSAGNQDIGMLVAHNITGIDMITARLIVGLALATVLMLWVLRSKDFLRLDTILGGGAVGLCVVGVWFVTSTHVEIPKQEGTQTEQAAPAEKKIVSAFAMIEKDGEEFTWSTYAADTTWSFNEDSMDSRPTSIGTQSFSFINPMGQTLNYLFSGFQYRNLTLGVMSVFGVILGSLLWSLVSRGFRLEWFASPGDVLTHVVGGALMGIGGTLAVGCTIGQGVTGASTLALGSFLALGSIVLGSAATMKIQYYKMVYESEATLWKAVVTAFVDLNLLPKGWRRLEAV